ncbi:winged helix-turn-helix transcriptional regulator [Peptoniphilaceae bacterium SGI.137]
MAAIWITGVSRPIPAIGCEADRAEEGLMQRRPMRRANARSNGPPTAKVFRKTGLADELGSGMRNSYKYTKMYSGGEPVFTEADVFTTVIPLSEAATATVGPTTQGTTQGAAQVVLSDRDKALVHLLMKHPDYTQTKIADALDWDVNTVKYYMNKLKKNSVIMRHGTSQRGYWEVLHKG